MATPGNIDRLPPETGLLQVRTVCRSKLEQRRNESGDRGEMWEAMKIHIGSHDSGTVLILDK
jgi:hypothetical protein